VAQADLTIMVQINQTATELAEKVPLTSRFYRKREINAY